MNSPRGKRLALSVAALGVCVMGICGVAFRHRIAEEWHLCNLDSEDFTERFRAAKVLGEMRSKKAIAPLIELLKESDGHNREATEAEGSQTSGGNLVAATLGDMGPEGVAALSQAMKDSSNEGKQWRRSACRVLAEAKTGKAVSALVHLLEDDYLCLRLQAFGALGAMGPEAREAVPALARALEDPNQHVRRAAAAALERIRTDGDRSTEAREAEKAKYSRP
jgi:HEAT repeat protein